MRTMVKAFVAVLPILALACFALMQQAGTTITPTTTTHVQPGAHTTPVTIRS